MNEGELSDKITVVPTVVVNCLGLKTVRARSRTLQWSSRPRPSNKRQARSRQRKYSLKMR